MSTPSLCVLSYNRPTMLQRCIDSIHSSADMPFELIVHDDGSTDPHVYAVLDALEVSTVITNPRGHNQGVGEAVRRMFQLASGDYLFKIDQDCTFKPGWLSEMVHLLERPTIGTVGGFRYWHDPVDHNKMLVESHYGYDEVSDYVSSVFGVRGKTWQTFGWETHSEAFAEDVGFKHRLSDAGYVHALTKRDVVHNDGFGVGPSTVVPSHGQTASIHKGPFIFGAGAEVAEGTPHDRCVTEATC